MKKIKYDKIQIIQTISPSLSTSRSIHNISQGNIIEQTRLQRLKDFQKICPSPLLENAIESLKRIKNVKYKDENIVFASTDGLDQKMYVMDKFFRKKELQILEILDKKERTKYWWNLMQLSVGNSLDKDAYNHPLKDYTTKRTSTKYSQNLFGFYSFVLKADKGFLKRQKGDPYAESNAIICLYKPVTVQNKLILYNIGLHDYVYNTAISLYDIDKSCFVDDIVDDLSELNDI